VLVPAQNSGSGEAAQAPAPWRRGIRRRRGASCLASPRLDWRRPGLLVLGPRLESSRLRKARVWAPFWGKSRPGSRPTLAAMNNPWLSLIAALSGQRINTPSTWPVREVHRLFDARPPRSGTASQTRPPPRSRAPWAVTWTRVVL